MICKFRAQKTGVDQGEKSRKYDHVEGAMKLSEIFFF